MTAATVDDYIANLSGPQLEALTALRETVINSLPEGYEEGIQYGAIGYYVPHSLCPDGYHTDPKQPVPFLSLAAKKSGMTLNFFGLYCDSEAKERFCEAWKSTGQKLDMGAACVRFKKLDDVPLDVVADAIASMPVDSFLEKYENVVPAKARKKRRYWNQE